MVCRIVLVRHGRTSWNVQFRYQGRTDVPCDEEGMLQTGLAADRLSAWAPTAAFCSPLVRARCLGEALSSKTGVPLQVDPRLTEMDFGLWEGLTVSQIEEAHGDQYRLWRSDPFGRTPPGGEDVGAIRERLRDFVRSSGVLEEERAVVVSHGYALRVLLGVLLGVEDLRVFWHFRMDNCSFTGVGVYGEFRMLNFANDRHHLFGNPLAPIGE